MKKTLVSALTTALVVGAASTTFAAVNPFSDVPADHWAYDSVSKLASEGVVTGYTDGSFDGNSTMTRYEMAQIVAKAMAKQDKLNADQKAMIDKLAAEFHDELASLGVRVANLEKKVDNVKWNGEIRYEFLNINTEHTGQPDANDNAALLRLEPEITLNDHWTGHARIDASAKMSENANGTATLNRLWAEGNYGNCTLRLGKLPVFDDVTGGMIMDTTGGVSGIEVQYGAEQGVQFVATAGRIHEEDYAPVIGGAEYDDAGANYARAELRYVTDKFNVGAGYNRISGMGVTVDDVHKNLNTINIWSFGAGYNFNDNLALNAAYAQSNDFAEGLKSNSRKSYNVELAYKEADYEQKGSFGIKAGYHQLGTASVQPTWDTAVIGTKGWFLNGEYTVAKNVVAFAEYFNGKEINDSNKVNAIYGKVSFYF